MTNYISQPLNSDATILLLGYHCTCKTKYNLYNSTKVQYKVQYLPKLKRCTTATEIFLCTVHCHFIIDVWVKTNTLQL